MCSFYALPAGRSACPSVAQSSRVRRTKARGRGPAGRPETAFAAITPSRGPVCGGGAGWTTRMLRALANSCPLVYDLVTFVPNS